jgi:predicted dehydrogenase
MQNRRDFLKMGIVGSAFLPTFANLIAKADQKAPVGQGKPREINIGIVGFGTMGKILSGYLARCEGVRVRCVCDIWKFRVKQAERDFKSYKQEINTYLDFQEMLEVEAKNIEAVIVSTPDWLHCEQVCACLRRQLHVYCAAPMAETLEKSAKMCRVAKASGKLLQIGYLRRSSPTYQLAFKHVIPEMLGRLTFAQAESRRPMSPMFMCKRPPKQDVLSRFGYENAEQYLNWRWFRKYGPGLALSFLASQADLFCQAWGVPPHSVTAVGGHDSYRPSRENLDSLSSIFEFKLPDGLTAHATHHFAMAYKRTRFEFAEFNGIRAILHLSETYGLPKADGPSNYVRRTINLSGIEYEKKWRAFVDKGWILPSDYDRECKDVAEFDCGPSGYNDMSTICPLNVKRDGKSDVMFHLENFLAAVRGEATLNAPADQVFASMVVAFGAIRSAARRETVYFKPSDFNP